jgi:hypothetical protein
MKPVTVNGVEKKVAIYATLVVLVRRFKNQWNQNPRTRSTWKVSISDKGYLLVDMTGSGSKGPTDENKEHNGRPETSGSWTPSDRGTEQDQALKTECDGRSIRNVGQEHPREVHVLIQKSRRG